MAFDHHQYVILFNIRSLLSAKLIVSRRKCKLRTLKSFIRQLELVRVSLVGLCSRTRNISARHLFFLFKGKLILLVKCPSLTLMRCSFNNSFKSSFPKSLPRRRLRTPAWEATSQSNLLHFYSSGMVMKPVRLFCYIFSLVFWA